MKNFLFRNKLLKISLLLVIVFLLACYDFEFINQPCNADHNTVFDVQISVNLYADTSGGTPHFGILLPIGWTVTDSIQYTGTFTASWIYSTTMSDTIENIRPAPNGYYWWVGVGQYVDSLVDGTVSFTPQIKTDSQSGIFYISYILGDDSGISGPRGNPLLRRQSNNNPITVGLPLTATVTNTNNNGQGSLRQAISDVGSGGKINFDLSYPAIIELNSHIIIDRSITISGPDSGELTISGKNRCRIFHINNYLSVNISNLAIKNGKADYTISEPGGGILCYHSNLKLENVTISDCYSSGRGGGIRTGDTNLELSNVKISNNNARLYGGGTFIQNGNAKIYNSEFTSNAAQFINCYAFLNNVTCIDAGILYTGFRLDLINSILWNNPEYPISAHGEPENDSTGIVNIAYSNIQGGIDSLWIGDLYTLNWLSGNIDINPMFVDTANGDYRLQTGSPCIDAGTAFFELGGDTLINLNPWQYNSSAPDMGAYEFGPPLGLAEELNSPYVYMLKQNYPNPFNPSTKIKYTLPKSEKVKIEIFNLLGQKVQTLINKQMPSGSHEIQFIAANLPSGVYLYRIEAGEYQQVRKMILLR